MANLITSDRASDNATLAGLGAGVLANLIAAASQAIEKYCHRTFTLSDYSEIYSGGGIPYMEINLTNYPVTKISRIATSPVAVLMIQNTDRTTNQRATVATTATGLELVRVASAVVTTSDLAFATYTTIASLSVAVNGLGNGWAATVQGSYGLYPSADLMPLQGAATALNNGAQIEMYTEDSPCWGASGIWTSPCGYVGDGPGWRLQSEGGMLVGCFPQGANNIRIDYSAGYASIPDPVQEACAQYCQDLYQSSLINNNVASAKIGPFAYTTLARTVGLTGHVKTLLQPYISHSNLITNQGVIQL